MTTATYNTVQRKTEDAQFEKEKYLRQHKWNHTSSTPGCYWLWVKEWEGGIRVMVDTDTAFLMQTHCVGGW